VTTGLPEPSSAQRGTAPRPPPSVADDVQSRRPPASRGGPSPPFPWSPLRPAHATRSRSSYSDSPAAGTSTPSGHEVAGFDVTPPRYPDARPSPGRAPATARACARAPAPRSSGATRRAAGSSDPAQRRAPRDRCLPPLNPCAPCSLPTPRNQLPPARFPPLRRPRLHPGTWHASSMSLARSVPEVRLHGGAGLHPRLRIPGSG
jgi:hypothetical protein